MSASRLQSLLPQMLVFIMQQVRPAPANIGNHLLMRSKFMFPFFFFFFFQLSRVEADIMYMLDISRIF